MIASFLDQVGDPGAAALVGLIVGLIFGISAEQSRFCLRAAAVEFSHMEFGPRFGVWLLAFSTAVLWTQGAMVLGLVDLEVTRWLASTGTISGAIIGGLIFGLGMVLARGCPGRLLVLGSTGNLRAILSGLVFAVFAQMTLYGALAPIRERISREWTTAGPNPNVLDMLSLPRETGILLATILAFCALICARKNRIEQKELVFGCGVGFAVAIGWFLTYRLSLASFDPAPVGSLTFSGPSADTLMLLLLPEPVLNFDVGLVPGVAIAAFLSAWVSGRLEWQGWSGALSMHRYLIGAALMGFGAMTAGGCTIGAGVTGGSTFAMTAWIALTAMWIGGTIASRLVDPAGVDPERTSVFAEPLNAGVARTEGYQAEGKAS